MKKRILCLFLAVITAAVCLPFYSAAGTNHTRDEAVAWVCDRGNEHWCVDVDGAYGCQCVDLILAYYDYLVGYHASGNAKDYATGSSRLPSGWTRVYSNPQPGDIVVWGAGAQLNGYEWADSTYGHIGVVFRLNESGTISTIETNTYYHNYAYYCERYANTALCYIRPDFSSGAAMKTPVITFGKTSYTVGEKVTLSWVQSPADSFSHYWISVLNPSGGAVENKWIDKDVFSYSFVANMAGNYSITVYVTPYNSEYGDGSLIDTKTINVQPAHTHDFSAKDTSSAYLKSAATCTAAAVYYYKCSGCTEKGTSTYTHGSPAGHKESAWITDKAATETEDGSRHIECTVCRTTLRTERIPKTGTQPQTDTVLGVSSARTMAGREITLTLSLEKNPGVAGLSVSLNYDTSVLTLKSASNGSLFTSLTSGKNYIFDNASNVTSDGTVATFIFTVNENAEAGDYTVTPVVRSCVNDGGEDVPVKVAKGTVTVIDFIYGDANDDEMIDMKDVVLVRRYLAEFDYETNSSPVEIGFGADANGDDAIDMKDVVLLRKYLANYDYETNTSTEVLGPQ